MSEVSIYLDGPSLEQISEIDSNVIKGFTFNPTLFRNAGVLDYLGHCRKILEISDDLPVSLEVIADDQEGMIRQARILAGLGSNVLVKVPITFTNGESTREVIGTLAAEDIKLNITAVFTLSQVETILPALGQSCSIISVFAGRLFDIGVDAVTATQTIVDRVRSESDCLVLWASPRMVYDFKNASSSGCDIITMAPSLIRKLNLFNKSSDEYSLDTVKMFYSDAVASGYNL
jgi:transaldolase